MEPNSSPIQIQNINRHGAVQSVSDQLMELIISQALMPGRELPSEAELAGLFGVGKSSIREALRSLEALGVVEIRHGKRAIVKYPSAEPVEKVFKYVIFCTQSGLGDILEMRSILEMEAVSLAAQRRSEQQLKNIKTALDVFVSSIQSSAEEFIENDMAFHISIADAAENIVLTYTLHAYREVILESIKRLFIPLEQRDPEGLLKRHINIYESIAAQDPIAARKAMEVHFGVSGILQKRKEPFS